MSNIILVAETGSDVTAAQAKEHEIYLVPMHVSMGDVTLDDGTFPPEDICAYYDLTGKVPRTAACNPEDFAMVFDEIHAKYPEKQILHLAYSAVTTCSYQNAVIASEDRDYVRSVDTKHASAGQASIVLAVAQLLHQQPDISLDEAASAAERLVERTHMCFIPDNLDYLRAGGRVSNAVALVGNILNLHPCIEFVDGQLIAQKKYRGSTKKIIPKLIADFSEKHALRKDLIRFIYSIGLSEEYRSIADETARSMGFERIEWVKAGCVITCHGGPDAFGIVGTSEK